MRTGPRTLLACLCAVSGIAVSASAAEPMREIHGSADGFAAPGVALAWAVLRGATEGSTTVVVRIAADPRHFPVVAATGRDPFTQVTRPLLGATPTGGPVELRVPRAQFADFPRTELRFYATPQPLASDPPRLVVFYLGVPDTTPEFASEAALESYLVQRLARARADSGSKAP
jgi:hypothetical protein